MADLTLHTNPFSRGRIARWMLEEVGEPYEVRVLRVEPDMKTPEYLALNPMGKVPTLVHDGAVVTEAAAICAHLAEAFPEAGLAPRPEERAAYHRAMFFAAGPLEAAAMVDSLKVEIPPDAAARAGWGTFALTVDALEAMLTGRSFAAGERFTAADVYVGASVAFGLRFGWLEPRPTFRDYAGRVQSREAHGRASALDDAAAEALG